MDKDRALSKTFSLRDMVRISSMDKTPEVFPGRSEQCFRIVLHLKQSKVNNHNYVTYFITLGVFV